MSHHRLVLVAPLLMFLSFASGCRIQPPSPGAVPLEGAAHMRSFLSNAAAWRLPDDAATWRFDPAGTFVARASLGPREEAAAGRTASPRPLGPTIPADVTQVAGRWEATTDTLTLTDLRANDARPLPDLRIPLTWLDGKRLIEIDGVRLVARWR